MIERIARIRSAGLAIAALTVGVLCVGCAQAGPAPTPSAGLDLGGKGYVGPSLSACSGNAPLAVVARLNSGTTLGSVVSAGFQALPLVSHPGGYATGSDPTVDEDVVAVLPDGQSPAAVSSTLRGLSGVSAVGTVYAQSSNPEFRSCAYDLSDRPIAATLVKEAESAASGAGYLSTPVLMALVSDDPLDANMLIVTLDVQGALETMQSGPLGGHVYTMRSLVVLATAQGSILDVGLAAW